MEYFLLLILSIAVKVYSFHNGNNQRINGFIPPSTLQVSTSDIQHKCEDACEHSIKHRFAARSILPAIMSTLLFFSPILSSNAVDVATVVEPVSTFSTQLQTAPSIQSAESQVIQLFEKSTASVVYINTFVEQINIFSMNVMEVPAGTGSGFIWHKEGHIVTNYHVIRNSANAKVTLTSPDGTTNTFPARVQGVDEDKDIAVLVIDTLDIKTKKSLRPVSIGTSSDLRVGQSAFAIGNPFGLDHTLTSGVISGLGREVRSPNNRPISNVIQTGKNDLTSTSLSLILLPSIIQKASLNHSLSIYLPT